MKNKKNKKKILSIVALAASFVLCIGATFGITLAYFGGNASAKMTAITLKTGVTVGAAATATATNNLVVPGQPVTINCTATISPYSAGAASNAVPGLLRAKFVTNPAEEGKTAMNVTATIGTAKVTTSAGQEGYWVKDGDYYYFCTSASGKQLVSLTATEEQTIAMTGSFTVPTTLDNTNGGETFSATVIFEVAQGELYNGADLISGASLTYDNSIVQAAFTAVAA